MPHLYGNQAQRRHSIRDASAIGAARRDAQRLAAESSLGDTVSGRIGVVVTELATNVLRHGGGGEILLQALPTASGFTLEVLAIDRGPGMVNLEECLRDGYSSRSTPGTGLGAVRRLSSEFDVYSVSAKGTIVMARIGAPPTRRFGVVCTPIEGETVCGDTWRIASHEQQLTGLMVIDGLGHGPSAADAAQAAAAAFAAGPFDPPARQIERAHQALAGTRGAAVACAGYNGTSGLAYAGIGNIAGRVWASGFSQGLVSHNGTLGFQMRRVQQFDYRMPAGALLIMHSDGLSARWDLQDHAGLQRHHPAVIAAALYRDHARGRDDATVVVLST